MSKEKNHLRPVPPHASSHEGNDDAHELWSPANMRDEELRGVLEAWRAPNVPRSTDARVLAAYRQQSPRTASFWSRLLKTKIAVPVPVFAAAVLLVLASVPLMLVALRPSSTSTESPLPQPSASAPSEVVVVERVEVPVERIVTRVVYVEKERRRKPAATRRPATPLSDEKTARVAKNDAEAKARGIVGFKPADEVKLRIIKGERLER
jgi:hypothetical protein